jgi:hypothetical protein
MATDGAIKEPTGAEEEVVVEKIELTQDELDARLQSETDKRVTQALKKAKADFEAEKQKAIETAKKEAEELGKLNAEERFKLEQEKERKKLDEERASFLSEKLMLETERNLVKEQIPAEFASFLIGNDADATEENIGKFKEFFQAKIQEGVDERLKGKSPKTGGTAPQTRYTREEVEKMSRDEITANMEAVEESMKSW